MSEQQRRRKISTVVAPEAVETIERAAEERRTTPSQVMRCLIEDGAKHLAEQISARAAA